MNTAGIASLQMAFHTGSSWNRFSFPLLHSSVQLMFL